MSGLSIELYSKAVGASQDRVSTRGRGDPDDCRTSAQTDPNCQLWAWRTRGLPQPLRWADAHASCEGLRLATLPWPALRAYGMFSTLLPGHFRAASPNHPLMVGCVLAAAVARTAAGISLVSRQLLTLIWPSRGLVPIAG
jgi:hypothetical protein